MKKTITAVLISTALIVTSFAPAAQAVTGATSATPNTVTAGKALTLPKVLGKVTLKKITNKKVATNKKVTVKPNVKVKSSKNVKIIKKTLTVKKGKKSVAVGKKSVKLAIGTYKVKSVVKYKVRLKNRVTGKTYWSKTTTKTRTQTLKVTKAPKKTWAQLNSKKGRDQLIGLINKDRKNRNLAPLKRHAELFETAARYAAGKDLKFGSRWSLEMSGGIQYSASGMADRANYYFKTKIANSNYWAEMDENTHFGIAWNKDTATFILVTATPQQDA